MGEQVYPAHREKLDKLITSIKFTPDDICGALYACLYDLADLAAPDKSSMCSPRMSYGV